FETARNRPGAPVTAEFRLRHADGSWRDIEAIGQSFLHDPAVAGLVANYRDVTERKRAEEALRESEQRRRSLTEALPPLLWAAAARLVGGAGRRLRLLQHPVDGVHRRRGGGPARLALASEAAPGGPRADAAALAGVRGGAPLL